MQTQSKSFTDQSVDLAYCHRRGQALIEFALVSLVLYLLLAAILTFGHALYVAQGLQTAADLASRELSRTPLPADPAFTFDDALDADGVRDDLFDEAWLVIDLNELYATDENANFFRDVVPQMPVVNQQLATMMIVDRPDFDGDGDPDEWLLRYPGALLNRTTAISAPGGGAYPAYVADQFVIGIPLVSRPSGVETITWVPVVEEIDDDDPMTDDAFQISSSQRGLVALRINYPFQSASMSSFQPNNAGPFEPTIGNPNVAVDSGVVELKPGDRPGGLTGAALSNGETFSGTYGGEFGLGAQGALGSDQLTGGRPVRPFRRVISAQAIYRREVFE